MTSSAVACSRCGTAVSVSPEALRDLPDPEEWRGAGVDVLCATCATTGASPVAAQAGGATRTFRVRLALEEWAGKGHVGPESEQEVDAEQGWEALGGFALRGPAESVAAFVDQHSAEFSRRMQLILDFADESPSDPPTDPHPEPPEPPPPDTPPAEGTDLGP